MFKGDYSATKRRKTDTQNGTKRREVALRECRFMQLIGDVQDLISIRAERSRNNIDIMRNDIMTHFSKKKKVMYLLIILNYFNDGTEAVDLMSFFNVIFKFVHFYYRFLFCRHEIKA